MTPVQLTWKQRLRRIFFFFPFQLVMVHLKRNHIIILFWAILFGYVTKFLATKYGIPYLVLYPEYLGKVNFTSHLILGIACGGFIMAFNISSYIVNGFRFPFLATLARPFIKYCINNFIIPVFFLVVYIWQMVEFQLNIELEPWPNVLMNIAGFVLGNFLFIFLSLTYFLGTNKNIFKLFGIEEKPQKDLSDATGKIKKDDPLPLKDVFHKKARWYNFFSHDKEWHVETYLPGFFKVALARKSIHYDQKMLQSVFAQNHVNASLFEIIVIITILVLGTFRESSAFVIPAGASIFLLFTMLLMLSSALHSWLKGWSVTVFIAIFFALNTLSTYEAFNYTTYAYGLNYETEKAKYTNEVIQEMRDDKEAFKKDFSHNLEIMNNWRRKNSVTAIKQGKKPKMVIVNTSGGGLRSAMWTFHTLQYADSVLNGELMNHIHLITGSSGGMVGAAYLRELYLQSQIDSTIDIYTDSLATNMGKDILNPVAYTITVNDLFFRLQQFQDSNYYYTKDRGYAFEKQLNKNTDHVLDKRLWEYQEPEVSAQIPMMIFSPTITNDGRRLIIASQPVSYMVNTNPENNVINNPLAESIEFTRFFKDQGAMNLKFTSALRMNATFPYVMPVTSLPSEPTIEVMDAGIRDNYGLVTSLKYFHTFRNWISTNTSGIILIQIRDKSKEFDISEHPYQSLLNSLISPLGSFYNNWPNIQLFNQDELLMYAGSWLDTEVDVIDFELQREEKNQISLSWHLTRKEKGKILDAIHLPGNKKSLEKLTQLLGDY